MPKFTETQNTAHSALRMFDLVADLERYPEFVPMCESLHIIGEQEQDNGCNILVADMSVGYKLIRETFRSRVALDRDNRRIEVTYLDGPFKYLENTWNFIPTGENTCQVEFYICYELKSRFFSKIVVQLFDTLYRRFVSAFKTRADTIYGTEK